jgi:hypothetical protein
MVRWFQSCVARQARLQDQQQQQQRGDDEEELPMAGGDAGGTRPTIETSVR